MNNYETVFIATSVLSDAQTKELLGKFQGVITENGGQITSSEEWGIKKLEYPIQKKSTGFYFLIEFTAGSGGIVEALETQYRRDERVIRFLTFRQDKHAVEYSAKRRAKLAGKAHEAATATTVAAAVTNAETQEETVKSEEE
jgi:small subunit ribosomal protein S6